MIYLELPYDVACSLAIIVKNGQSQIGQAVEDLKAMLEGAERPEGLKEDQQLVEHIKLHNIILDHSQIIIQDIEQAFEEEAADFKASTKPDWLI